MERGIRNRTISLYILAELWYAFISRCLMIYNLSKLSSTSGFTIFISLVATSYQKYDTFTSMRIGISFEL